MKNWLFFIVLVNLTYCVKAQYIPAKLPNSDQEFAISYDYWHPGNTFRHLRLSATVGTTGIGFDIATPLCQSLQLRAGYEWMPHFKKTISANARIGGQRARQYGEDGNRLETPYNKIADRVWNSIGLNMEDHVYIEGKLTMQNLKVMIDYFPFRKKNWFFTAGIYWGPSQILEATNAPESDVTTTCIGVYNRMYDEADASDEIKKYGKISFLVGKYSHPITENGQVIHTEGSDYYLLPDNDGKVRVTGTANRFKPYIGFGYGGPISKTYEDWRISFECGALFWGGSPAMITNDGTNLTEDVKDIPGFAGDCVKVIKIMKVYPQLSIRLTKRLF